MNKSNRLIIFIAISIVLFSESPSRRTNAIRHFIQRMKNKLSSECATNYDCHYAEICRENKCVTACLNVQCGMNEGCQVINDHYATCQCSPGFIRDGQNCVSMSPKCYFDEDCDNSEICTNHKCVHVCSKQLCGRNKVCQENKRHGYSCECSLNFIRDPITKICIPEPSCFDDNGCKKTEVCRGKKCVSACDNNPCGPNEGCQLNNWHSFSCQCLPGYNRDMTTNKCEPDCIINEYCDSIMNAKCLSIHHVPTCQCLPGYVSTDPRDPILYACVKSCSTDNECSSMENCQEGKCKPVCNFNTCESNEQCMERQHYAECVCEIGFISELSGGCKKQCKKDADCYYTDKCDGKMCISACDSYTLVCPNNAKCVGEHHLPVCKCDFGFIGKYNDTNNLIECSERCRIDIECTQPQKCINGQCQNLIN